jgi:WD40 repeat protein
MLAQPDLVLTNEFEANYPAFSPDSKILAVAGISFLAEFEHPSNATNRLAFWDLGSRRRLPLFEGAGAGPTEKEAAASVEFSSDGRLLAIGFRDGADAAVRLWDVRRQKLIKPFKAHTGNKQYGVEWLSFSADGHWLASCAGDTMVIYDLKRLEAFPIRAHTGGVRQAWFAPDNKTLITSGSEGRIKFWNLATREVALTLRHSDGPNLHIALTADGNLLASMDGHGIVKFWPAASWEEINSDMQKVQ